MPTYRIFQTVKTTWYRDVEADNPADALDVEVDEWLDLENNDEQEDYNVFLVKDDGDIELVDGEYDDEIVRYDRDTGKTERYKVVHDEPIKIEKEEE